MSHLTSAELIADFCHTTFPDLKEAQLDREYYYAHLPLCVVDSVFSMGVKYESVRNVIGRIGGLVNDDLFRDFGSEPRDVSQQISITEFQKKLGSATAEELAEKTYGNRQRTSARNGILKADAVNQFLQVLTDFEVAYFQDVPRLFANKSFELHIRSIPGQTSGICLSYFFMLAGNDTLIKPDRMVQAFLGRIVGKTCTLSESQEILTEASNLLNGRGYEMNPRLLDNIIWNYQRKLATLEDGW